MDPLLDWPDIAILSVDAETGSRGGIKPGLLLIGYEAAPRFDSLYIHTDGPADSTAAYDIPPSWLPLDQSGFASNPRRTGRHFLARTGHDTIMVARALLTAESRENAQPRDRLVWAEGVGGGGIMDWNGLIAATLTIYRHAARETVEKLGKGWWIALLPLLYTPLIILTATFFGRRGFVGGLLVGLVMALCTSSYLYFIDGVVHGQRVQLQELLGSWRPHFGSVISILFFLMLIRLLFSVLPGGAGSQALYVLVHLILPVLLSPVTEVIYQGQTEGWTMIQESFEFLRDSGVEWFVPLVGLAAAVSILGGFPPIDLSSSLLFPLDILAMPMQLGRPTLLPFGIGFWNSSTEIIWAVGCSFFLYLVMVFRGLLFRALASGTRRQRIFRSRLD